MTEPDVASSDATNIATRMVRDGDDYVINGRKWFITGAAHPRCSFLIVMGVTDSMPTAPAAIPASSCRWMTPGVRLVRRLRWMGCRGSCRPDRRADLRERARAPRETCSAPEGDGFKVAQIGWAGAHPSLHALDRACANC
jgi:acyl-CoA dehydrogenase